MRNLHGYEILISGLTTGDSLKMDERCSVQSIPSISTLGFVGMTQILLWLNDIPYPLLEHLQFREAAFQLAIPHQSW